jgi:hypothetical protein
LNNPTGLNPHLINQFVMITNKREINILSLSGVDHGVLSQNLLLHHHIASIVKLAFVPESAMGQVIFACGGAYGHLLGSSLVVCSSLISASL